MVGLAIVEARDRPVLRDHPRDAPGGVAEAVVPQLEDEAARVRGGDQGGHAPREPHLAAAEQRHPVGEPADLVDSLGRPDDGGSVAGKLGNKLAHVGRRRGIEVVRGLVHE